MNSNGFGSYTEFINKRLNELGLRPRKDAVVMNSFVVGSDKAFFDGGHAMIFESLEGKKYLSLHYPNTTPNERAIFIPYEAIEDKNDFTIEH